MRTLACVVFVVALIPYWKTWQAIRKLVAEVNQVSPEVRYSSWWWLPAWKSHRKKFPASNLRRQIIYRFLLTWTIGIVVLVLLALDAVKRMPTARS